ncbi:MAG TPA: FAD-binding oxidoreductase [Acidimicrobiia bacterium]|nr:FAD-binding oxidoreductase [Acidimicrobiia bacterium]
MTAPFADGAGGAEELLSGWGRTSPTRATVLRPTGLEQLVARVTEPGERGVIARGLGRSYGDAAQNAGGTVLSSSNLGAVLDIDVDKGTVTVESGVSLDTLLRVLLPIGWIPMVIPGTSYVTVGGAIASDIHGKFRHGSFADYVECMHLVTPDRGLITLEPGADANLFWATSGGMGLTGVIADATLKLHPVETSHIVCDTERTDDVDDCMARMLDGDREYRYSVAWIDCLASGGHLGRGVLTRGNHATLDDLSASRRATARTYAPRAILGAPRWLPNGLLNSLTVRAFNEFWFRKAPSAVHRHVSGIKPFFFPLDSVQDWNRIYGSRGFVQYQFVVPFGAEHVVRTALERFSAARTPTFLAVLKRFEHDSRSLIGFPMSGWTLALDIPTSPALAPLLDGLDELVVEAGGRVYLTKDARLRPELLSAMYPRLDDWRESRAGLDRGNLLRSDMDRRLDLSGAGKKRL